MPPLRLVLDTNVLISAALKRNSLPHAVLVLAFSRSIRLYVSQPIVDEYEIVMSREELGIRKGERLQMLQLVKNHAHQVNPARQVKACRDPDDNKFLECSEEAHADYLITGNRKHFPATWKKTTILTSREFVELVKPDLLR
jgi:uncharacterized protein